MGNGDSKSLGNRLYHKMKDVFDKSKKSVVADKVAALKAQEKVRQRHKHEQRVKDRKHEKQEFAKLAGESHSAYFLFLDDSASTMSSMTNVRKFCILGETYLRYYRFGKKVSGRDTPAGILEQGRIPLDDATAEIDEDDDTVINVDAKDEDQNTVSYQLKASGSSVAAEWAWYIKVRANILSLPDGWENKDQYRVDSEGDGLVKTDDWPVTNPDLLDSEDEVSVLDMEEDVDDVSNMLDFDWDVEETSVQHRRQRHKLQPVQAQHQRLHQRHTASNASHAPRTFRQKLAKLDKDLGVAMRL